MEPPESHYYSVSLTVPPKSETQQPGRILRVRMPTWTPGSYLVREFARNVIEFSAKDADTGSILRSHKTSKNCWAIEKQSDTSAVIINYKVYAFEHTVDTSYLDGYFAVINGASVFVFVEGYENDELGLTVAYPSNWNQITTSLERMDGEQPEHEATFRAPSYDILVDSPIEMGNQQVHDFEVDGVRHEVSLNGDRILDDATLVKDLQSIVRSTCQIIGTIPYKHYLFLIDFVEGPRGGGLEHLSSTHCLVPRLRLMPEHEYKSMLGLFSHEFFHAWNVKRMRPSGLGPFNYSDETYTKSLWIAEGITSYYDELILRRARIYSVAEYLDALSKSIDYMNSLPGSSYESAQEASFNTWIGHYRPDENSDNVRSSYYEQGAIVGWMLDMEIRHSTNNERTLDDAMRRLYYDSYVKQNRGYLENELEDICREIAGPSVESIFDSRVRGKERIDFGKYLDYAGLQLSPRKNADASVGFLGVKLDRDDKKSIVSKVLLGSPAAICGIASGDEIIAVNDMRIDSQSLAYIISNSTAGKEFEFLIARGGVVRTSHAIVREFPEFEHRVYKLDAADSNQKQFFASWLGENWDVPIDYKDYPSPPHENKIFDYI